MRERRVSARAPGNTVSFSSRLLSSLLVSSRLVSHSPPSPPASSISLRRARPREGTTPMLLAFRRFRSLVLVGAFAAPISAQAPIGHFAGRAYPSDLAPGDFSPIDVALRDFNGDGRLDFAVVNSNASFVSVGFGDGAGHFNLPVLYGGLVDIASSFAVGDLDGNGRDDLVVAVPFTGKLSTFLCAANGTCTLHGAFSAGPSPRRVALGDFNLDGRLDVAVTNSSAVSPSFTALAGDGSGGLAGAVSTAVGGSPLAIAVSDFNADGRAD